MKRKSIKIVVCPYTGDRLCNDNKWRSHANFGSTKSCVKEFKTTKPALKAGERYRHPRNTTNDIAEVIHIYPEDSMDASGKVTRGVRDIIQERNESMKSTNFFGYKKSA